MVLYVWLSIDKVCKTRMKVKAERPKLGHNTLSVEDIKIQETNKEFE